MKLRFESIEEYRSYFKELIEKERVAEKEFHLNEIKRLSGVERQKRGRAILGLRMRYVGEFLDFKIYRFNRNNMPEHQIKVGDIVLISRGEPLKFNQEATVSAVGKNFIEVYSKEPIFRSKLYRLDLFVNDITFKRMLKALDNLENSEFDVDIILGKKNPKLEKVEVKSDKLNDSQNKALSYSINSETFLIHGPPGTGKTTTLAEVIKKHIGKKILVCADSNVAVDNVLEKLSEYNVVRIGHPAKIESNLMKYSLDVKIRRDKRYKEVEKLIKKIDDLKYLQEKRTKKPTPSRRRGMSDEEILDLAKQGKGKRGVKVEWIKEMAEWLKIQRKISKLYDEKNKITEEIMKEILNSADIVFATNSGAGSEFLEERKFDVVFLDEAAQSMEPSTLIPLIKAKQSIFAGDDKQLPPTILSNDERLKVSMFERFHKIYPIASHTLEVQYRMNEKINNFPSCEFYECKVKTYEKIKNITLKDLGVNEDESFGGYTPIVFFDTRGKFLEETKKDSPSKYNPKEAEFVLSLCKKLIENNAKQEFIGVITPYKDHEEYIKKLMENEKIEGIEIKSVDGFQGREKEIIIVSLVRANEKENIGFLDDIRRLNVAITRPKRKLIIVGDAKTLSTNQTYQHLIDYVKKEGKYLEV
ncbi:IGHMBP2 family helicase [Caminibacter mediatlanticus]|uniref:DNA helicase, UvrD/REP family protein n=1 Tax=Caminibacter mediatlanticus TB-2 TaxID=391592 RepID=A0AAI9AIY4_9BACT|nr:IGHMBP2 family helicase [Caminibacter mediatlanticus]EDM24324.1 DNA helicase, UvrD/REP family protein [Caminibacter mediatlanticus TB-2]